ncbi:MAG: DNA-binding protein [Oscillospiraceae bacterium]|nr:DNA-binding protein [Oscillospiraceae bacterium]
MIDSIYQRSLLFDFFGDLLPEKQYKYFDLYYNENLSLREIAESAGITRQGVHYYILRAEKSLVMMEEKTGVVEKWLDNRTQLEHIKSVANELSESIEPDTKSEMLINKLLGLLEEINY